MKLDEFIAALRAKREFLIGQGIDIEHAEVVVWDANGEPEDVTDIGYDKFEQDGPWVIEIRKAGDP